MLCPYCQTDNREDRETCYTCGKDISTIRLVVNKARQHYNDALEHAERGRTSEAIEELKNAIDLDWSLVNAHVVMGTLYARTGEFARAREAWKNALALQPELERAHDYLERVDSVEAALPTMRAYRWAAMGLLLLSVVLSVWLIYLVRPPAGAVPLREAVALLEQNRYGDAEDKLSEAKALAEPGAVVSIAAAALDQAVDLSIRQQVQVIQDLKYRQLYPEALEAIAHLEKTAPDAQTSAVLAAVRSDITYYYHNLIAQLYTAYQQGDLDFETFHGEISRFIAQFPALPADDEIRGYLDRAERMEVQAAMDDLRRRFALDNNVEVTVEALRDLSQRLGDLPSFYQERQAFIEEILSSLFSLFTGYLDQDDFARASTLLSDIDRVTREFRDVVEVDVSGAVDLAWSVLRDARRRYSLGKIESYIRDNKLEAAEEGVWTLLQEEDLTSAELNALRGYWRKINRDERYRRFVSKVDDQRFFKLEMSDRQASAALRLQEDFSDARMKPVQQVYLLGLASAAALKLGLNEQATSYSKSMARLDKGSTVTKTISRLISEQIDNSLEKAPRDLETSGTFVSGETVERTD